MRSLPSWWSRPGRRMHLGFWDHAGVEVGVRRRDFVVLEPME